MNVVEENVCGGYVDLAVVVCSVVDDVGIVHTAQHPFLGRRKPWSRELKT